MSATITTDNVKKLSEFPSATITDDHLVPIANSTGTVGSKTTVASLSSYIIGKFPQNKEYDPLKFSGLGKVYLKKNIVTIEGVEKNVLVQDAFYKDDGEGNWIPNTNTIFVVDYAFDLNGQSIDMPAGCVLEFDGGSVSNGFINSNDTILLGTFDSSCDNLFGVFYDEKKNKLGWDKQRINNWKTNTEYGNLSDCIEPGEYFGGNQSMAMDANYFYLIFSQNYIEDGITLGQVTVVMYDKLFNYIGYSLLDRPSHANGATMYNNNLYIACNSNVKDDDTVHVVSTQTLHTNCVNNKGHLRSEATVTSVTPLRLGYGISGIDYDSVTNTFCVRQSGGDFKILDTSFNVIKQSEIGDYREYGYDKFGRGTTVQDFVYRNGIIYAFDWDYNYPNSDNPSTSAAIYIIDAATDKVVDVQPLHYSVVYNEPEGVCKDPVTGIIYTSNNNHGQYRAPMAFTVCSVTYGNSKVDSNRLNIENKHWFSSATGTTIYVNNSYTGVSCGSGQYPYKTLGEALVMTGNASNRIEFNLIYTGIPYYIRKISITDVNLKLNGILGPNNDYPEIDGIFEFRACTVNVERLHFRPSEKHDSFESVIYLNQHNRFGLLNSMFTNENISVVNRLLLLSNNDYARITSTTLDCPKSITASHILFMGENSTVRITSSVVLKNGTLANPGELNRTGRRGNSLRLSNINSVVLQNNATLVYSDLRMPSVCVIDSPITSISELNQVKNLFFSPNLSRRTFALSLSFYVSYNLTDDSGRSIKPGWYTNEYETVNGVTLGLIRSISDSSLFDGVYSAPTNALPEHASNSIGRMVFDTTYKKPLFWNGSTWVNAEGIKYDESSYMSNCDNLIKNSSNLVVRNSSGIIQESGIWRRTKLGEEYRTAPSVNASDFSLVGGVNKEFVFTPLSSTDLSEIAYNIQLESNVTYTFSCWTKGTGILNISFGYIEDRIRKGFSIDSEEYSFICFSFKLTDECISEDGLCSIYLAHSGNTLPITVCAPKLEVGDKATLWNNDSKPDASLLDLKVLSIGDSITRGWRNGNLGYSPHVSNIYSNVAVSGSSLSTAVTGAKNIPQQLIDATGFEPDVVIGQGGYNDWANLAPLGILPTRPVRTDSDANSLDLSTVYGGVQMLFYKMIKKYPHAQRFFFVGHKICRCAKTASEGIIGNPIHCYFEDRGGGYTFIDLCDGIKKICDLYGVVYIDLFNLSFINTYYGDYIAPTTFDISWSDAQKKEWNDTYYCDLDGIHPTDRGYREGYAPIIREALKIATINN